MMGWSPLWNPAMWAIYFMTTFWIVFMIGHTIWYRIKLRRLKEKALMDNFVEGTRQLMEMASDLGTQGSVREASDRLDAQMDELAKTIEEWDPDEKQVQQMPKAGEPRRKLART